MKLYVRKKGSVSHADGHSKCNETAGKKKGLARVTHLLFMMGRGVKRLAEK